MRKKVVRVVEVANQIDPHANGTRGSNYLTLECGHVRQQKGSVPIPKYCNCHECDAEAHTRKWKAEQKGAHETETAIA